MSVDTVGNFLVSISNATKVAKLTILVPYSKMKHSIAEVLLSEGFIRAIEVVEDEGKKQLKIYLKYLNGESAIHDIKRVSKLGRRVYASINNIEPVIGGLGLTIVSTSRGILSHKDAEKLNVGGEVICTVW